MKLTDLNGPLSLELRSTGAGRILRAVQFAVPRILFLSLATFGATISRAQDQQDQSVAEAARQERARKQEAQKSTKHVYTEEDLKHPHILTPEDRAQIEAKRTECAQKNNCSPAAPQNSPASLDANSQTPQIPLGDRARFSDFAGASRDSSSGPTSSASEIFLTQNSAECFSPRSVRRGSSSP
jgi:hypothetical protein